jgi:hypothetical protein
VADEAVSNCLRRIGRIKTKSTALLRHRLELTSDDELDTNYEIQGLILDKRMAWTDSHEAGGKFGYRDYS